MTPDEFKDKMYKLYLESKENADLSHPEMDDLMCQLLKELGYGEGVKLFNESDKWYA